MAVEIQIRENVVVACLSGEIDHHSAVGLRETIDQSVIQAKPEELILDFSLVTFMDSSGIGLVMGRFRLMQETGGRLVLQNLPAPDAVFIGGSKGNMQAIVDAALAANPQTRLCIAAIALETLQQSIAALAAHGLAAQVTQIAVSRSKAAGSLHLMMANNPVFLIVRE